jgi:hypothetical protein
LFELTIGVIVCTDIDSVEGSWIIFFSFIAARYQEILNAVTYYYLDGDSDRIKAPTMLVFYLSAFLFRCKPFCHRCKPFSLKRCLFYSRIRLYRFLVLNLVSTVAYIWTTWICIKTQISHHSQWVQVLWFTVITFRLFCLTIAVYFITQITNILACDQYDTFTTNIERRFLVRKLQPHHHQV